MKIKPFALITLLAFGLVHCTSNEMESQEISIQEITEYETLISVDDEILATPVIMKFEKGLGFFIYDEALGKVLWLSEAGEKIQEFGQKGRGPGEFQRVNNIFIRDSLLYVTDPVKFSIHRFELSGELESTLIYGEKENQRGAPPPPPMGLSVQTKDINNQPAITYNGDVLLSAIQLTDSTEAVFNRTNWESEQLSSIGEIPQGSTFILDNEKIRDDVNNRVVPSYYRSNAFPVNDQSNKEHVFLVYSSLPKIMKYSTSGEKIWERNLPSVAEMDSITNRFCPIMERMQQADIRSRIGLEYYASGVSGPNGHLFLVVNRNPLWIHEFNPDGDLIKRYTFSSPTVSLAPIFDIDFENRRFLVVTEDGEVRA
ncbi:hypothetical protein [Gracilimonas sp.]|uniref:hypothetical protein n=1 Tax=Gracilimonas sp. TaxID=1974203 RepID=UPI0028713FE9|nr:hypothetical protein [Gracilimonas sp.]